ncbi:MAG: DUF4855 domain-containing protein [Bacteroidales bacterium]|nr:DUF4855 domain-containing protein [Bacteroidales bacterium]
MNKSSFLFLWAMLVPMVLSCVNEVIEEPGDGLVVKTFTGYSDMETKTSIDNEFNILWDEEDHITVFAGDGKGTVFSDVAVSDDCTVAEFTGKIDLVDTYYALYPAQDAAVYASDGEKITAELPSLQTALAGSFADEMNLAVAKTRGADLHFRNVGALLAVKCPTANANSIKIVSHDPSVKMSGDAIISMKDGVPVAVPSESAVNYVEATCATTKVGDVYYFVVYPGDYKGFDIIFTSKYVPTSKAVFSTSKTLSLKRNDNVMLFNADGLWAGWNSTSAPFDVNAELAGPSGLAGVSVKWSASGDGNMIDGYNIYAKVKGSQGSGSLVGTVSSEIRAYTVSGLTTGAAYVFGVQTKTKDGYKDSEIVWSSEMTLPQVDKCIAPSGLVIDQQDEASVKLTWTCGSSAETGFMVYKKEGDVVNTAVTAVDATEYTFRNLTENGTYEFGVQTRGAYNNHSDVVYADPYTLIGWKELQDSDAGDAECVKPENITYIQETSNAVIFNWECWSSANVGFNLYVRPKSESEFNSSHFKEEIGRETKSYCFSDLTTATEYVFGIQTKGKTVKENSDIVEIGLTVKNFAWPYPYESGREIPSLSDMTLCYGGNPDRVPYLWTKERWKKHAVYTDKNGKDHWFFDAFLALEFNTRHNGTEYVYDLANTETYSAGKEQWIQQLDYWFDGTYGFQALDDCIGEAVATAGPYPHKRYIVFSLPDPVYFKQFADKSSSTKYWGTIDGETMDFSKVEHRQKAYKWMINQVRARFAAMNYEHIELAGFYIIQECLSESYNSQYKKFKTVISDAAAYCKTVNEGMYWVPYGYSTSDTGHNTAIKNWKDYGFTATTLQPNKYFDSWRSWDTIKSYVQENDLCMELEFEGSHGDGGWSGSDSPRTSMSILETVMTTYDAEGTPQGSPNKRAERNKTRFREYMQKMKDFGLYGNKMIVLYSGTDGLYELASSSVEKDKELYYELGEFITGAKH